jgi:hypothetical protein
MLNLGFLLKNTEEYVFQEIFIFQFKCMGVKKEYLEEGNK